MPEARSDALRPRERILLAARDLFHRHGIRGVGVETIAEAAGLTGLSKEAIRARIERGSLRVTKRGGSTCSSFTR